jgi:gamma-D-glutamyl-L-lysine dipeptidyl-peptidase
MGVECWMNRGNDGAGSARTAAGALVLLLAAMAAGAQQSVAHPDLVVARPVVNMLRNADGASDVVSQAIYGTGVVLLEKNGAWEKIRTADEYTGWVAASDLALTERPYAPEGRVARVAALDANIYRDPDVTRHAPLLQLPWEARVELVSDKTEFAPRWLEVRLVDGQTAWVQRGDVSLEPAPVSIADMLEIAHRFLGITYTWGGVSSYGFDCSGFTQMLERQRGIVMPRDADLQAAWNGVVAVERKDLEPGDLLFFGSSAAKITHTGMYLGNGQFIHDTTHDHPGVQISKLDDMPWTKLLVAARRVK